MYNARFVFLRTLGLQVVTRLSLGVILIAFVVSALPADRASAEPMTDIVIDGDFSDWASVPSYFDPDADPAGTVEHCGIPDVHDTNHEGKFDIPDPRDHVDVDLLEYKFTHDADTLYAYFRADGVVGRTQQVVSPPGGAGRFYVIVTIDVDDDDATGYWLNEGGYYPTSRGYDVNIELEFYNGAYNTGHYINHGATTGAELAQAFADQKNGVMDVLPGTYDLFTQWVWWDAADPPTAQEISDCATFEDGPYTLPDGSIICFVRDRGPVFQGILTHASSPDGHELEMAAPFRGLMKEKADGTTPIVDIGSVLDISFSLEASGELSGSGSWASDTADPIVGYVVGTEPAAIDAGKLYWADAGTRKIQRANRNGTNVEDIIITGLTTPSGVAVDSVAGKIYWTDIGTGKIERADLDGSNREDVVTGLGDPNDVAMDPIAGKIYWTDDATDAIERANLEGSDRENLGIAGLSGPNGIAIDPVGEKVYWTDDGTKMVHRANLDGSGTENLVSTGGSLPMGIDLDLDAGKMYWATQVVLFGTKKIQRADLDGSNVEDLVIVSVNKPVGIAVDPAAERVYWTAQATGPEVAQAALDGSRVKTLITCDISDPRYLTLHVPVEPPPAGNVPVLSDWSRVGLLGVMLLAGTVILRRRHNTTAPLGVE